MSNHGARMLLHLVIDHRRQPLSKISNHLNICCNTTRLHPCEMDFRDYIATRKSHFNNKYKIDRLAFA